MALCMEAFTDTLPIVCNGFMYGFTDIYRHFTNQCVMALCMEAFTDTLPIVCNGFMYGSIYRHFTNSV